jgi:hypothetical protein
LNERPDLDAIEARDRRDAAEADAIVSTMGTLGAVRFSGAHADRYRLLAYARGLEQERAELLATLANERGEGEPPSPGWYWSGHEWFNELRPMRVARYPEERGWRAYPVRPPWGCRAKGPTARAAMRAADSAEVPRG